MTAQPMTAVEVPLLHHVQHGGRWRRLVGTAVNVDRAVVSMSFENWGGVVEFTASAVVEVLPPEVHP